MGAWWFHDSQGLLMAIWAHSFLSARDILAAATARQDYLLFFLSTDVNIETISKELSN